MAELRRTFSSGRMNKDIAPRLLPPGEYTDALNLGSSETDDLGILENILGNDLIQGQEQVIDGRCIGIYRLDLCLYWFVEGNGQDAIYKYDQTTRAITTLLIDTSTFIPEDEQDIEGGFILSDAGVTFSVDETGEVSLSITTGQITSSTYADGDNIGTVASPTLRRNELSIRVPRGVGFSNEGEIISGVSLFTQQPIDAFTFDDAGVQFSVNAAGLVSLSATEGTIASATHSDGESLPTVNTPTTITNTVTIQVPNEPSRYTNAGETVGSVITAIQPPLSDFLFSEAGVNFSVSTAGIVSLTATQGTIASATFTNGQDLGAVVTPTLRTNSIVVNVPDSPDLYFNAGETVTGTLTYEQEPAGFFQFDDAGISFSVNQAGAVSLSITTGTIESATFTDGQQLGTVAVDTTRDNTISVRVPNDPGTYGNANELVSGSVMATQLATVQSAVTFADTGVTCNVDTSGNINLDSDFGSPVLAAGQVTSYPTVSSNTVRNISVRVTGNTPVSFTGADLPFDVTGVCQATQEPFEVPTWTFGAIGVSCSVDSQTGDVSVSAPSTFSASLGPSQPSSYGTVSVATVRVIVVRVTGTVPGGYVESGNSFDLTGNCTTTQQAVTLGAFTEGNWTGSVSVSPLGQVLSDRGNVGSVTTDPTSFDSNSTDDDISRTLSVTLMNIPGGFSNTGGNITFNRTVSQPSSLPCFTASDWSGVVAVTQTGSVTSTVGNGGPIMILTTSVPANNQPDDITVQISVQVTIPAGFKSFGSTTTVVRGATQPGLGSPTFTNTVTIVDSVTNATVNSSQVLLSSEAQGSDFRDITVTPNTGFEFTSTGNINVSSTNQTLASGLVTGFDSFGLGGLVIRISGTIGSSDQSVTLTVSGAAIADATALSVGPITSSTGSSLLFGTGTFSVAVTGGTTPYSVSWSVSGQGITVNGQLGSLNANWAVNEPHQGGQVRADVTDNSGNTGFATFTFTTLLTP